MFLSAAGGLLGAGFSRWHHSHVQWWCWQLAGARGVTELHVFQVYSYDSLRISLEERISPNGHTVFEPPFVSCLLTCIWPKRSCGQVWSICERIVQDHEYMWHYCNNLLSLVSLGRNTFVFKHSCGIRFPFLIFCQIWYFNMPGIWFLSLDFIADMFFFSLIFYSLYLGNYSLLQDIVLFIRETAVMS